MAYGWSAETDEAKAVNEAVHMMEQGLGGDTPKLVTIFTTGMKYDEKKVFVGLKATLKPEVRIWGLNSDVTGTAVPDGIHSGLTIMGFSSPDMIVGVGTAKLDYRDPASYRAAGRQAILAALSDAGQSTKGPPKILFFAGLNLITDTAIFQGMEDVVGKIPIWGGNAGQESGQIIPGDGFGYSNDGVDANSVTVAALWMDSKVGVAYGYGYTEKPEHRGTVTKADIGKHIVYEIDHRPAADVYNEWTGGKVTDLIKAGGGLVPLSVIGKYGLKKPIKKDVADYLLVGFNEIYPDKSVLVAHEGLEEGTEISLVEFASEKEVTNKPGVVATIARNRGDIPKKNVAGALFLHCYAQFYVAKECGYDVDPMFSLLGRSLRGAPFAGFFGGGEIGHSPYGGNRMMAFATVVVVFGKN